MLVMAAGYGDARTVSKLCSAGAGDVARQKALSRAAFGGHVEVVRILVTHGTDINGREPYLYVKGCGGLHFPTPPGVPSTKMGYLPIHIAAVEGHEHIIRFLCAHAAHINPKDNYGNTPVNLAARYNNLRCMEVLFANGADGSIANDHGQTPAHMVRDADFVKVLANYGAPLDTKDKWGWTPMHRAVRFGNTCTCVLLRLCRQGANGGGFGVAIMDIQQLPETCKNRIRQEETAKRKCQTAVLLMSAGCRPTQADLQAMNSPARRGAFQEAREFAAATFTRPPSLQYMCKLAIRRSTHNPLPKNVPRLCLPQLLKGYLLLEVLHL